MYTNVDQITNEKLHELENILNREKPHLVAMCEVKSKVGNKRQLHEYELTDYRVVSQLNMDNDVGRGVVILSHSSISHLVVGIESPINFEEACIIEVRLSGNDMLTFGCMYRSPTNNNRSNENNTDLNNLLKILSSNSRYSHKCFVGDFNFPTINWRNWTTPHKEESKEERFLEALRDSFLSQNVEEPTRCRGTDDPSLIDLILTGEENQITNLEYLSPLGKSDHSVLVFDFNCYVDNKIPSKRYMYYSADYTSMKRWLDESNWIRTFVNTAQNKQVGELWQLFTSDIVDLRNRFVPLKEFSKPFWKKKGKFPINKELQNAIKDKKHLHRKWIRSPPDKRHKSRQEYITSRNRANRMLTRARRVYEKNICDSSKDNPKIFWSHVRNKLKSSSGVSSLLESPSDKTSLKYEDCDKANILQKQFCSVFTQEPDDDLPDFERRTDTVINELHITKSMVINQIQKLQASKSLGPDEIHPKMLKELVNYVAEPLAIIMNKTLEEGVLPEDWKVAHVTPIYKNKGAKNLAVNYRPVSLTSIVCKMMESMLRQHIMNHLNMEKLLSHKQYGFINNRSTVTQLLNYIDKCCENIAQGKVVDVIYFDFAKAFDTVPHQRLCKKLKCYGIRGSILRWITAFLLNRKQLVKVNGFKSKIDDVISGIPQGSVLGPLLFVIYINDLPDHVISDILLFADDTKIFKEVDSIADSILIQKDINTLEKWSRDWLLKFHPDKCHVMTLGKFSNIKHAHPYKLDGEELEHVLAEKDLGILVDSDLTFEEHITKQVNKANSMLGLVKRCFDDLSPGAFRSLYTAFVRPHLEYAQSVWQPKLRKYVNLIENVQRRATKLVKGCRNLPYGDRLKILEIPSLEFRRHFCDMVQVYKHLNVYDRSTVPSKFIKRTRPSRRHAFELQPNFASDGVRGVQTKSFYYRSIPTWNTLPREVVDSPSVKVFKERLTIAWKNHPLRYYAL